MKYYNKGYIIYRINNGVIECRHKDMMLYIESSYNENVDLFTKLAANGYFVEMPNPDKPFIHSRHFWCNVFIITVALIACMGFIFL